MRKIDLFSTEHLLACIEQGFLEEGSWPRVSEAIVHSYNQQVDIKPGVVSAISFGHVGLTLPIMAIDRFEMLSNHPLTEIVDFGHFVAKLHDAFATGSTQCVIRVYPEWVPAGNHLHASGKLVWAGWKT